MHPKPHHSIVLSLLLFVAFAKCKSGSQESEADDIDRYLIAYNVSMNGEQSDYDIWTIDPKTKTKTNITNHKDVAWTYAAYEDKILFVSDRDTCSRCYFLYEMDSQGKHLRKISDFKLRDSWMGIRKGGAEIIVNPHPDVDSCFLIINLAGDILHRVCTGLPYANDPVFSPDGHQILFRGGKYASKRHKDFVDEIYSIGDDGTKLRQLTYYPAADTTAPWYAYKAGPPKWHPTENFISYQSLQDSSYKLYRINPDGGMSMRLTDRNNYEEGYHDWASSGNFLAVELFDFQESTFDIALMNWQTRAIEILTDSTFAYEQAPVFVKKVK